MENTTTICPICREQHEPRSLSFDGHGINSCGMYRSRIATFAPDAKANGTAEILGPLFAAAPELKEACIRVVEENYRGDETEYNEILIPISILNEIVLLLKKIEKNEK
jgi:hypothetical protein